MHVLAPLVEDDPLFPNPLHLWKGYSSTKDAKTIGYPYVKKIFVVYLTTLNNLLKLDCGPKCKI